MKFIDSFDHTMDGKGRLVLPATYRDEFRAGAYLSSKGSYLAAYTMDDWEVYVERLEAKCLDGQIDRDSLNTLYSSTSFSVPDNQGRILVNPVLRAEIGLDSTVRIRGHGNHLGIYVRRDEQVAATGPSITDVVARLSKLGL